MTFRIGLFVRVYVGVWRYLIGGKAICFFFYIALRSCTRFDDGCNGIFRFDLLLIR